ncbi:MAG: RNA polymerase sigma factor [Myxococcota bacterium]
MVELNESVELAEVSDDALMRRCVVGDNAAFRALVKRYERSVLATCRRLVPTSEVAAEDAAQDTFVQLWRQRSNYTPKGEFRSYLFALCLNVCRHATRSAWRWRRRNQAFADECSASTNATAESEVALSEHRRLLLREVDRLPKKQREAVTLRFFGELTYEELERSLGIAQSTLRSRVQHGVQRLAKSLNRSAGE